MDTRTHIPAYIRGLAFASAAAAVLAGPPAAAHPEFFGAVGGDDLAAVERLLAEGMAPNVVTGSLYHAVSARMVAALVAAGADPAFPIRDGGTALHFAAHDGRDAVVRALLDAGVDVNVLASAWDNTPLHVAVRPGARATPETLRILIDAGADVNARTTFYGSTPLHFAAKYIRNPAMTAALLDAGADPLARVREHPDPKVDRGEGHFTPLDMARKYNPGLLDSDAGRRLAEMTRNAGLGVEGCDGVVVQPTDVKLSLLAERVTGRARLWRRIVELNGLEDRGYRAGDCLALP